MSVPHTVQALVQHLTSSAAGGWGKHVPEMTILESSKLSDIIKIQRENCEPEQLDQSKALAFVQRAYMHILHYDVN